MSIKSETSDSLSQGDDYLSLLNDSITEKWVTHDTSLYKRPPQKSVAKDALNYLEDDVNHLGQEVMNLRSQNCYLEAQLQVLVKEKDMHVTSHAKEKLKLEAALKELTNKYQGENKELKQQLFTFKNKVQELEGQLEEEQQKRMSFIKKYKTKLVDKEKELLAIIRDKEKYISQLQSQLEQGKCSRACTFSAAHAIHKRNKSKKKGGSISTKTWNTEIQEKSESRLDSITNMIVKLEKEQADINQTISDFDFSLSRDKSKRSLKELMSRNEERLKEAKAIQQNLLKEKFSSTYST